MKVRTIRRREGIKGEEVDGGLPGSKEQAKRRDVEE